MSLFRIAWRSIQQRGLASFLTAVSMALGVMMVVAVLSVHGVVSKSFRNNSSLGYNQIVGARGGKLQLTMNTVFYLSQPVANVPYEYYLEFVPQEERQAALANTIRGELHQAQWDTLNTALSVDAPSGAGLAGLAADLAGDLMESEGEQRLDLERGGKFGQFTAFAIPVCLGDYFGPFRVVGTTPDMFDKLRHGPASDESFEFAAGRNFQRWSKENGYFEAVVGAAVAREMKVGVGDGFSPSHGDPDGDQHGDQFKIVGVLDYSGTPNDRAAFINLEGFYLMDDHARVIETGETEDALVEPSSDNLAERSAADSPEASGSGDAHGVAVEPEFQGLPVEQRDVSAVLVRTTNDLFAIGMADSINKGNVAQCVQPIREITLLFDEFVGPVQLALLVVTALICVVSGVSILVSIYNSMSDRKHEIAVMRALGASRATVMTVILLESVLLSLAGGIAGWVGGHALNTLASGEIEARTGVSVGFFSFAPPLENLDLWGLGPIIGLMSPELWLIPAVILLAIIVGLLPAMSAYQTDVAKSLGS